MRALNRFGFGPAPGDVARVREAGADAWFEEQLHPEQLADDACEERLRRLTTLTLPAGELFEYKPLVLRRELTYATLLRAVYSRRQLYEVMVEFWRDHFNIDMSKGGCRWLKVADERDVIRRHALGNFRALLGASALSPAMLWYLDGRVNRVRQPGELPNENYARELLELHTLGVHGGYTQRDVMEVARCFSGWTVRGNVWFGRGEVEFRPRAHDDGAKEVLGRRIPAGLGAGDVDAVLDIVAAHPATARHIAEKLCRRFVADDPPADAVDAVAQRFAASGGDLRETLRALWSTGAFRTAPPKFKRPFRFVASALRATAAHVSHGGTLGPYLMRMGHLPFSYPTPEGYPDERGPWASGLYWRWHFAGTLAADAMPGVHADWEALAASCGGVDGLAAHLVGRAPNDDERQLASSSELGPGALMAAPAFQWC